VSSNPEKRSESDSKGESEKRLKGKECRLIMVVVMPTTQVTSFFTVMLRISLV
jgi:hypothetical protein